MVARVAASAPPAEGYLFVSQPALFHNVKGRAEGAKRRSVQVLAVAVIAVSLATATQAIAVFVQR